MVIKPPSSAGPNPASPAGAAELSACKAGERHTAGSTGSCVACPDGSASPGGRSAACQPCRAGLTNADASACEGGSRCSKHCTCGVSALNRVQALQRCCRPRGTRSQPSIGDACALDSSRSGTTDGCFMPHCRCNEWLCAAGRQRRRGQPAGEAQREGASVPGSPGPRGQAGMLASSYCSGC